jgi:cell division protein ZapA
MSNVTLQIGGRTYRLGCAEGEEQHISRLGDAIDAKLAAMPGMAGQSEAHTLLYAALLMADELDEARKGKPATQSATQASSRIAEPLEMMADRLESLASRLEGTGASA